MSPPHDDITPDLLLQRGWSGHVPADLLLGDTGDVTPPVVDEGVVLLLAKPWSAQVPANLTFGDDGEEQPPVDPSDEQYQITMAGRVTVGLRGVVRLQGKLQVSMSGGVTRPLGGLVQGAWNVNVSRPRVAHVPTHVQLAKQVTTAPIGNSWRDAQPARNAIQHVWQDARRIEVQVRAVVQQAARAAQSAADWWQDAQPVRSGWQSQLDDALHLSSSAQDIMQPGLPRRMGTPSSTQQGIPVRGRTFSSTQQAGTVGAPWWQPLAEGVPLRIGQQGRLQQAIKPGPGQWGGWKPPPPVPCWVPAVPADLLLQRAWPTDGHLIFTCCKDEEPVQPVAQYVIPLLRVYMQVHTLTAQLLPGLEPVVLHDVTISTDDDSYCWSLSASGPEHLLEQLQGTAGLPARIRVSIDGIPFVFAVTVLARSRSFERRRVSVQGVSVTSMLGAPYMPQQTWLSDADQTAQQLATAALEYTGVTLDWGISDWLVPAGAWSHKGTPLQAVLRIAESVGAVVRSHRTDEQLIIAPRYPVLPWEWSDVTPDVQMPAAVIVTDELRPDTRADYNAVYVLGGAVGGVKGHIVRALSARDKLAPAIQDDLITHADAARMRGSWALAASGNKRIQSISMPVLTSGTNPGVLQPGQLLEVDDTDGAWRGLVRAVSVGASMSKVRQQVTVERVAEEGITA